MPDHDITRLPIGPASSYSPDTPYGPGKCEGLESASPASALGGRCSVVLLVVAVAGPTIALTVPGQPSANAVRYLADLIGFSAR